MEDTPTEPTYTLDELATLTGLARRTVRYYIQLGLVDRPIGETRAARYTPAHLEQLLTVVKYSKAGLALDRIADLLKSPADLPARVSVPAVGSVEVRSHLQLDHGVELVVEAGRAGLSPEQVRQLFKETLALYQAIQKSGEPQ